MSIHPIETESYRRMRLAVDFSRWHGDDTTVVERMVHATADQDYSNNACIGTVAVSSAVAALRKGAPVVTDAHMVRVGIVGLAPITGQEPQCGLDRVDAHTLAVAHHTEPDLTRSALGIRLAALAHPNGAVFVIGNAPTALFELLTLAENGWVCPAMVIGLPVGFVGATESKAALRASELHDRSISNTGPKGGSAVAAATINAVIRLCAQDPQ